MFRMGMDGEKMLDLRFAWQRPTSEPLCKRRCCERNEIVIAVNAVDSFVVVTVVIVNAVVVAKSLSST